MAVTLAYLLVGSFWFQHWYLLWVLAPAVLLPTSRWTLTLLPAYCLGALWSNLTNSFARNQPGYPLNDTQVGAINVLAQVAPGGGRASDRQPQSLRHWLDALGGGLDLTLFSGLPKGSGMGTSSILVPKSNDIRGDPPLSGAHRHHSPSAGSGSIKP